VKSCLIRVTKNKISAASQTKRPGPQRVAHKVPNFIQIGSLSAERVKGRFLAHRVFPIFAFGWITIKIRTIRNKKRNIKGNITHVHYQAYRQFLPRLYCFWQNYSGTHFDCERITDRNTAQQIGPSLGLTKSATQQQHTSQRWRQSCVTVDIK